MRDSQTRKTPGLPRTRRWRREEDGELEAKEEDLVAVKGRELGRDGRFRKEPY